MIIWSMKFRLIQPMLTFPRPLCIEREIQNDKSYYNYGPFRYDQRHCFVKYTLAGKGMYADTTGKYELTPGTALLCDVTASNFAYYFPADSTEPWEFIWFGFVGGQASAMTRELILRYGPVFSLPQDKGIIARIMKFKNYDGLLYEITPFDGANMVNDMLSGLAASAWTHRPDDPAGAVVRKTFQIINDNIEKPVRIHKIAAELNISREHLSRVFKHHTGMKLKEYILKQKISMACRLLRESELSNKQISARLGFDRATHFTRSFKNILRITPTQFRQMKTNPPLFYQMNTPTSSNTE